MPRLSNFLSVSVFCLVTFGTIAQVQSQGVLLRGIGAVSESMGGTAIATPLDAAGAIYANPAAIAGIEECQIGFDLGIIIPQSEVTSGINGMPSTWGTSKGDAGQIPAPTMSMVYRNCPHSRVTYGLAIAGVGGAVALYPSMGSPAVNPIMQGEARSSNVQVFEILPTVSYKMTDRLALGFSPVIGLASLSINPMPLGLPASSPMHNYGTRYTWGGGFNIGVYYDFKNNWKTGFTFKSPLWTKSLQFTGTHPTTPPTPGESDFGINLPLSIGWGLSYGGFKKTIIGLDVRYMDYEHTRGFRDVMDENGTIIGLGWDSVVAVSVGMQYTVNDRLKLRAGYCYNTNPIPSESQQYNVSSPMFMQHVMGIGCTIALPKSIDAHLTWSHAFENTVSGEFANGQGTVINSVYADTIVCGVTKRF